MKRFINWHKEMCELFMEWSGTDWYTTAWISWVKGIIMGIIIMSLLTSCYVTSYIPDPIYEDRPHTTEVYYNGIDIYWGYHSGFYYYYGTPHFYPWWNYYNTCPPSHYNTTTHVVINRPVNKPTHRPNRPNRQPTINKIDYDRIFNINPQTNIRPTNNNKPIINNNKVSNKNNRSNNSTNKNRKPGK